MKRVIILALFIIVFAGQSVFGLPKKDRLKPTSPIHFDIAARGGFFMPEDPDFRRIYGRWSNDMYFLEFGWYPFKKGLVIDGTVGAYTQRGHPIGTITGAKSSEITRMTIVPLEVGLGYRFKFRENQLLVPELGANFSYTYFAENPNPGKMVEGWKSGYTGWGGLMILLDRFEPHTAWLLFDSVGIDDSYLEIAGRYTQVGTGSGLNLSGATFTLGLVFDF
jgi:hypothetical protein